ncbi:hypothetical protein EE612_053164, partial [Oryza sativa]
RHIIISLFPLLSLPPPLSLTHLPRKLSSLRVGGGHRTRRSGRPTRPMRGKELPAADASREKGGEATAARGAKATSIKNRKRKPRRISR